MQNVQNELCMMFIKVLKTKRVGSFRVGGVGGFDGVNKSSFSRRLE